MCWSWFSWLCARKTQPIKSLFLTQRKNISKLGKEGIGGADFWCWCILAILVKTHDPPISLIYSIRGAFLWELLVVLTCLRNRSALKCNYNGGHRDTMLLACKHPVLTVSQSTTFDLKLFLREVVFIIKQTKSVLFCLHIWNSLMWFFFSFFF